MIALEHPPCVARQAAAVSRRLAEVVPAIVYEPRDFHTTLGIFGRGDNFVYAENHRDLIETLRDAAVAARKSVSGQPGVTFGEYLYTPEVTIASGQPNEAFVELVNAVEEETAKRACPVRPAWGAHGTLSRVHTPTPSAFADQFCGVLSAAEPLGESRPVRIVIGHSGWWPTPDRSDLTRENAVGHLVAAAYVNL